MPSRSKAKIPRMKTSGSPKKPKPLKTKNDSLVGQWQNADEGFGIVLEIAKTTNGYDVRAFDNYDNEELVVSKIKWDGKALRFETVVPSTNYRTRNTLTLTSRTKLVQELTFWEQWKKIPFKEQAKRDDKEHFAKSTQKKPRTGQRRSARKDEQTAS